MLRDSGMNVFSVSRCFQRGAARPPGAEREAPEARKAHGCVDNTAEPYSKITRFNVFQCTVFQYIVKINNYTIIYIYIYVNIIILFWKLSVLVILALKPDGLHSCGAPCSHVKKSEILRVDDIGVARPFGKVDQHSPSFIMFGSTVNAWTKPWQKRVLWSSFWQGAKRRNTDPSERPKPPSQHVTCHHCEILRFLLHVCIFC